jgi:hypothetical protein
MAHSIARATLSIALFAFLAGPVHAQYRYPGGYGGWGGWGGASTLQEGAARGMGVYAAGAGAYNEQTAQARSINANTAMQMNEYMYQVNQRNAKEYYSRSKATQKEESATGEEIYRRLHDNPSTHDVHTGDALNVVLDELTNPMVLSKAIPSATQSIDSRLVKNIDFEYAANMIAISLEDLSAKGAPDVLLTSPDYKTERDALRAMVAKARKEASGGGQISPETLASCREAIKALQVKVSEVLPQGSRDRNEADNYLKALYGLTKMLQTPSVEKFLKGLDKVPTTTLGHLISFMHSFNLRFGVAKTPEQEAAYDQLFPMLVQLRNQLQAPESNPYAPQASQADPKRASAYFSGMSYGHFGPQPDPHTGVAPAPPQPGRP